MAKSVAVSIRELVAFLPNPKPYEKDLTQRLVGEHRLLRQVGDQSIEMKIEIDSLRLLPEGSGLVQYAIARNLLDTEHGGTAAFFDCGRTTVISYIVDMNGSKPQIAWASRSAPEYGLELLLGMIQSELKRSSPFMQAISGRDPKLALLNKGICDGTFEYGNTGFNFESIYQRCAKPWLKNFKDQADTNWRQSKQGWLDDLNQLVFGGGAAPIANVWAEDQELNEDGWIKVLPESQIANVLGAVGSGGNGLVYAVDPGSSTVKIAVNNGLETKVTKIASVHLDLPADYEILPGEINSESCAINYLEGCCEPFRVVVGSSAPQMSKMAKETIDDDKGAIAHKLILASIAPPEGLRSATPPELEPVIAVPNPEFQTNGRPRRSRAKV
ncbi:hypothetical protein H6G00_05065 [Leptolyngbya sp. FACHB-541]|uniref:hypothetical protein n=1 Tax=Leptolyngbya sp. FACHB-541 TaxID=2692810 RepID=UPI001689F2F6|nr:hypothetical protein [Leptolyngbya sp. FACHB-541]MBD1995986.1 hypothetical protein [Leptolyngbya sp. FACHB-541]